jgi:hypothetical protein
VTERASATEMASEMALLGLLSPVPRIAAKPNTSVAMLQNAPTRMPHTGILRTETMVIADAQSHTPNTLRQVHCPAGILLAALIGGQHGPAS